MRRRLQDVARDHTTIAFGNTPITRKMAMTVFPCSMAVPLAVVGLLLVPCSSPAQSQTLHEAMAQAYRYNPRLDAERARLRAIDEEVPRAMSGWRPTIDASADMGVERERTKPQTATQSNDRKWGDNLTVRQSLFNGFRTVNGIAQAEAKVRAGRAQLRLVEQEVLINLAELDFLP